MIFMMKSNSSSLALCIGCNFTYFCAVADLSHSETRLSVYLDNFELHVYNRTAVYSNLEKLFGIDQLLPQPSESLEELVTSVLGQLLSVTVCVQKSRCRSSSWELCCTPCLKKTVQICFCQNFV